MNRQNITLWQLLKKTAALYPQREAIVSHDERLDYETMLHRSEALAASLLETGITHGTHVGLWLKDGPDYVITLFALWSIGAVPVPVCTGFGARDLEKSIALSDIVCMLVTDGDSGFLSSCREQTLLPPERIFFLQESGKPHAAPFAVLKKPSQESVAALPEAQAAVQPTDTDLILFTSGSTGGSKPVMTTHYTRVNNAFCLIQAFEASRDDRVCSVLPMYHCFSITANILVAFGAGACLCCPESRKSDAILHTIAQERCTILSAVPTLFSTLLRRQREQPFDLSSLRTGIIGGSTYSQPFFTSLCRDFDFTLLPSIGQTEATAGYTIGSLQDSLALRSQSLGRAFPGVELCIRVQGQPVADGTVGEICVRGFNIMQGYYKNPTATEETIDKDGWMRTGDLGYLQGELLYYAGRIKEIINRGGEKIFPGELEAVLSEDPRVAQVKVIGLPDPHYIETVCACIIPDSGCHIQAEEMQQMICSRLSPFKMPKHVLFMDAFPLNGTGKVDRSKLCELAMEQLSAAPGQA